MRSLEFEGLYRSEPRGPPFAIKDHVNDRHHSISEIGRQDLRPISRFPRGRKVGIGQRKLVDHASDLRRFTRLAQREELCRQRDEIVVDPLRHCQFLGEVGLQAGHGAGKSASFGDGE